MPKRVKPLPNANFQPPVMHEDPNAWVDQIPVGRYIDGPDYELRSRRYADDMADTLPVIVPTPTAHSVVGVGEFSEILTGQLPAPALQTHEISQLWHSIGGVLSRIGNGLGTTFMRVWDSKIGSALLVGGLITLAVYIKTRGPVTMPLSSADFPTVHTPAYSQSRVAHIRKQALDSQARSLVLEGADAQAVEEARQRAAFVLETPLAKEYVSTQTQKSRASRDSVQVAGQSPAHYVGIHSLPMDAYLDSLQKPERAQDIIVNSALIHGLKTK